MRPRTCYGHCDAHPELGVVGLESPHGGEVPARAPDEAAEGVEGGEAPGWRMEPEGGAEDRGRGRGRGVGMRSGILVRRDGICCLVGAS